MSQRKQLATIELKAHARAYTYIRKCKLACCYPLGSFRVNGPLPSPNSVEICPDRLKQAAEE